MYKDILPAKIKQEANERQIDAFYLFLFSYDLQFIYKKYSRMIEVQPMYSEP